jgi:hypothetical protein
LGAGKLNIEAVPCFIVIMADFQVGIIGHRQQCKQSDGASTFVRLSEYLEWIQIVMDDVPIPEYTNATTTVSTTTTEPATIIGTTSTTTKVGTTTPTANPGYVNTTTTTPSSITVPTSSAILHAQRSALMSALLLCSLLNNM